QSRHLRQHNKQTRLAILQPRIRIQYFYDNVQRQKQASIDLSSQLHKQIQRILPSKKQIFQHQLLSLDNFSPTKTMLRGYSIVKKDDEVITSSHDIHEGERMEVTMKDGDLDARNEKVRWQNDDRK
ncbi:exodeoxyribonuclease VII large subunit, partial [Staphylococcus pseudintermedius]|uniref:exodeoxyribonuclease VII large subunit n=1 Tax=Staphylococcus pseudintermedius TaxID=283734 RepID=UPI000D9971DF